MRRKYRRLISSHSTGKPGPKGLSAALIHAVVEKQHRNPHYGGPRIAQQVSKALGVEVDKDMVRRILAKHYGARSGAALCRLFNQAIAGMSTPKYRSSEHDPLFNDHRSEANLRVLEINELKPVPYTPVSHPFVERLIGSIRREWLHHVFFWTPLT